MNTSPVSSTTGTLLAQGRRTVLLALAAASATVLAPHVTRTAHAQTYADSVTQFSGVQGQSGWYYGFYESPLSPAGFTQFPIFGEYSPGLQAWSRSCNCPGGYWTFLSAVGGHPNGLNGTSGKLQVINWSVRRYVFAQGGPVTLSGQIRKSADTCGNGIVGRIFVNGQSVLVQPIAAADTVGVSYSLPLCLTAGSVIDLAIDPNGGDDNCDSTFFTARLQGPITQQPVSTSVCSPSTATFTIATSSTTSTLQWQWRQVGEPAFRNVVIGANTVGPNIPTRFFALTNNQPSINILGPTPGAAIEFRCIVTTTCGSVTSDTATLTTNAAPKVVGNPGSVGTCPAQTVEFSVAAVSTQPVEYQWQINSATVPDAWDNISNGPLQRNGVIIAIVDGANESTAHWTVLDGILQNYQGYGSIRTRCVVSNPCGSTPSEPANLIASRVCACSMSDIASDSSDSEHNPNDSIGPEDLEAFINGFINDNPDIADVATDPSDVKYNPNGTVGPEDLEAFINAFIRGC